MAIGVTKELTEGKALPLLLRFSIPLLLGGILQQLYQLTDSTIVSRFLGVDALAAVGASTSIVFLILGFCNGCGGGMAIPVAQAFGARDYRSVRRNVFNALYVTAILALVIAGTSALLCGRILHWIRVPTDILPNAQRYLLIILLGIPATFFYNLIASIIRSLGDSQSPFWFLLFSTFLNIALDLLLIIVLRWGVAGAAIATVFSQGLSAVLCYVFMVSRYAILRESKEDRRFDGRTALRLLGIGAPMGFQFSITAIGSIMVQSANNALGTMYVAAFAAGMRIKMFFMCPLESLGMAMTTYAGQNLGAGKMDRVMDGVKAALLMIVVYCVASFALLYPTAPWMARLFADASEQGIIQAAALYIRISVAAYFMLGTLCLLRYTIQGLGYTHFAMWSGVTEMVARTLVAVLLVRGLGFTAIAANDAIAWVAANLFLVPAFFYVFHRLQAK